MFFQRFFDENLAQASYLVGCQRQGVAAVIDPARNVAPYLEAATAQGMKIVGALETHIHADFLSGRRELVAAGAVAYLSGEGGPDWLYGDSDAVSLKDGSVVEVGNLRLEVLHTPGHTPEHIAFLLTDGGATDRPMGLFSGDCLFVGDVGRPDLLEKAAGLANTKELGARQLYASIQRLRGLPDYLQVWPGHGAGSACGKGLGAVPQSSLGYEKLTNWAMTCPDEAQFVETVLEGQPEPPRYFAEMKARNRRGPDLLPRHSPRTLSESELTDLLAERASVIDARPAAAENFYPGSLRIPAGKAFANWAGWLIDYDRPIYLISDAPAPLVQQLQSIGLDRVEGSIGTDLKLRNEPIRRYGAAELREVADQRTIIDLRNQCERDGGWIPGSVHIPTGYLLERYRPGDRPVVLQCQSGYRSLIGVSLLARAGHPVEADLRGGYPAWSQAGYPVESPHTVLSGHT